MSWCCPLGHHLPRVKIGPGPGSLLSGLNAKLGNLDVWQNLLTLVVAHFLPGLLIALMLLFFIVRCYYGVFNSLAARV